MIRHDRFALRAAARAVPHELDSELVRDINRLTQRCWTEGRTFSAFDRVSLLDPEVDTDFEDSRYMRSQISDRRFNHDLSLEDYA